MVTWSYHNLRATIHTRLRARDHYPSSSLIGGKAEPVVQVRTFTPRLRDRQSMWMQDGCESLHGFLHGIKWITFRGHLNSFQKPPGDHGTPNAHNRWFILFDHVWGPSWIEIHWNSIWLRIRSHMASHYTWGSATTRHDFGGVLGTAFGHFLLGSHNFMVMAFGLCVKWPLKGAGPLRAPMTCPDTFREGRQLGLLRRWESFLAGLPLGRWWPS